MQKLFLLLLTPPESAFLLFVLQSVVASGGLYGEN